MNERHDDRRLSERGEARKRQIFDALAGELDRVRVGRVRRRRAAVGVCVLGFVVVGVWVGMQNTVRPTPEISGGGAQGVERGIDQEGERSLITKIAGAHGLEVRRFGGAVGSVERVRGGSGVERVGDSVLLAELREMGQGVGMIRREGAVYLTASVGRVPKSKDDADEPGA